jgi:predicted CopG family antitoxin
MKAITIRGIDNHVSEKLKETAKEEGKSVNRFLLELINRNVGGHEKKKYSKQYKDLDHLFGRWSEDEFLKMQNFIETQRNIDQELWR